MDRINKINEKMYQANIDLVDKNRYLQLEIERLNNIIDDIEKYIHKWKIEEIGEKTMLILNDILLIKNGMSDEVVRLEGE